MLHHMHTTGVCTSSLHCNFDLTVLMICIITEFFKVICIFLPHDYKIISGPADIFYLSCVIPVSPPGGVGGPAWSQNMMLTHLNNAFYSMQNNMAACDGITMINIKCNIKFTPD